MGLVLSIVTTIGLAAPAVADADVDLGSGDVGFLAALQDVGITYSTPEHAIESAHAMCRNLHHGQSGLQAVQQVKIQNPPIDLDAASRFAVIAAKYYCPEQLY
ncbi:hypothetical protein B1987_08585 [Mycobacterium kansasii]|uniref:DUF732 domain-containing protein n=2 Tax=Mycobacterium attenuatum TaxID=2341086 RepID=A0A498QB26_9MYCO|nr:hypothetical protein B1987_08585 [Mycobacterium kansasii]VBA42034.1 hypothetical protein LAUMK136_04356 [Mycobacterium attenuatum]VBA58083.1 hypothetical protein LAUMK191_04351 [Mycobacterium attenuatum]VBA61093.1 hypothetical protein LAUMK41_04466 [Mycobacterium attenuatum]